jgi:glycosyltransferase involved in cell wall biosynthesis
LFYNKKLTKYWDIIEERFNPEIVHFHGTEYTHGISYLRKYPDKKKILTIQGIIDNTSENHWGGLPKKVLLNPKHRTLKEMLHFNGMIERKIVARKNVKYETEIIKNIQYATGRTDWDKFYMKSVNPEIKYYRCFYDLREEFYSAPKWNIENINRNVIYAGTSAQVPMKGGHIVLEALNLVKREIPDVKVVFIAFKQENGKLIPTTGYTKYIASLIEKYDLYDNVEFISNQNCKGIIDLMTNCHAILVPSASENASATLREAMHLGAPCIASFRGGMVRLIDDGKSGFFFDYTEYEYLAGRIIELLKNDDLACEFSKNAIEKSSAWHDKDKNKNDYLRMYNEVYND